LITDLTTIKNVKKEKIKYTCACGEEREKLKGDFLKNKECRSCKTLKFASTTYDDTSFIPEDSDIEIWKKVIGGWISSEGNAINIYGKKLKLDSEGRYNFRENKNYIQRHIAFAFEIKDFDKLVDQKYCVTKIEETLPYTLKNIKITERSKISELNGLKSRSSDRFYTQSNLSELNFLEQDRENRTITEMPNHIIYKNGEIFNGTRFLTFSLSGKYHRLNFKDKSYKVHRLVCYAFHPIEGKTSLSDYDDLQVNHKDGNTLNNHADNLEWTSSSENISHAYSNDLNKKKRKVLQYHEDLDLYIEYESVAEASRETGEPEHRIRETCNGKSNSKTIFNWSWENEEESEEFSKKFSHF
jgi:hypothetical protein